MPGKLTNKNMDAMVYLDHQFHETESLVSMSKVHKFMFSNFQIHFRGELLSCFLFVEG